LPWVSDVELGIMPQELANSLGRVLAVWVQVWVQEGVQHDRFLSENLQEPAHLREFCGKAMCWVRTLLKPTTIECIVAH
jgi:hypothetical protein